MKRAALKSQHGTVDEIIQKLEEYCKEWSFTYAKGLAGCGDGAGKLKYYVKTDPRFLALKAKYQDRVKG